MTDKEDRLASNYAANVLAFIEEDGLTREHKLERLNGMAGGQMEKSRELLLYQQSCDRANAELVRPELEVLTKRIVELRAAAGMDKPAPSPAAPSPPITGARTLLMNDDGTGRVDPVRTQVLPGASTDEYAKSKGEPFDQDLNAMADSWETDMPPPPTSYD